MNLAAVRLVRGGCFGSDCGSDWRRISDLVDFTQVFERVLLILLSKA
jgi:hypothetical protein